MRAFISIEIPKEIRDELWKFQKGFKEFAKVKWVSKKHYHLCLKFLGNVSEDKIEKVKIALRNVKFESFEVSLNKTGVFPNEGKINVVWFDLTPVKDIMNLQNGVEDSLTGLFERGREFAVHVTLGRVKRVIKKKEFIEKLKSLEFSKAKFKIENFYLIKSELTKEGPKYKILEKFNI